VQGTAGNPVIIKSSTEGVSWGGIVFESDSNAPESQIEYSIFRGAEAAVDLSSNISLDNCTFSENDIGAEVSGSPSFQNCVFTQNSVGISVYGDGQPVVRNSTISGNVNFGIEVTSSDGIADARNKGYYYI